MKISRTFSPYTREAARLLGARIQQARVERRWSTEELADRVGITRPTLHKIEAGDPTVGLGVTFEAAAILGVTLFHEDRARLRADSARVREQLALLPQRVRASNKTVDDAF
jgi:transcriptional regulator with XRE-family HTH domain